MLITDFLSALGAPINNATLTGLAQVPGAEDFLSALGAVSVDNVPASLVSSLRRGVSSDEVKRVAATVSWPPSAPSEPVTDSAPAAPMDATPTAPVVESTAEPMVTSTEPVATEPAAPTPSSTSEPAVETVPSEAEIVGVLQRALSMVTHYFTHPEGR